MHVFTNLCLFLLLSVAVPGYAADEKAEALGKKIETLLSTTVVSRSDILTCQKFLAKPSRSQQNGMLLGAEALRQEQRGLLAQMESLETLIGKYQTFNGNAQRMSVIEDQRKLRQLKDYITRGDDGVASAVDLYRQVFRDVEYSSVVIRGHKWKIRVLERRAKAGEVDQDVADGLIAQLQKEIEEAFYLFGKSYGQYMAARGGLEDAIRNGVMGDTSSYTETVAMALESVRAMSVAPERSKSSLAAEKVLNKLGVHSLRRLFPALGVPEERAKVIALKRLFRTIPNVVIVKLEEDVKREKKSFVLRMSYQTASAAYAALYKMGKIKPSWIEPLSNIMNMSYDVYAHDTYVSNIEYVLERASTPDEQLAELMKLSAITNIEQMLVTFARIVETSSDWVAVRARAQEMGKTVPQVKWFEERMAKAEEVASKMTPLSIYNVQSGASRVGVVLTAAGAGIPGVVVFWNSEYGEALRSALQSLIF